MKFLFIPFFLLASAYSVWAQSSVLEQYIQQGLQSNLAIQQQQFNLQKSQAALDEAKGLFLPSVSFEASYTLAVGGRKLSFPIGDLLNPVYSTLNLLTNSSNFPTVSNVNEQLLPNNFHETKIRTIHPLYNAEIRYNKKIKQELISLQTIEIYLYKRQLVRDIKTAYYQYLQATQAEAIYQNAIQLLKENLKVNESLVKNQKITKEVLYRVQAEISEVEFQQKDAENKKRIAQQYLNFLINQPIETELTIDSTLLAQTSLLPNPEESNYKQREELQKIEQAIAINELQQALNESYKYPKITQVLDAGFQGFQYKFNNEQAYVLYNITLSWNIFKGNQNKAKIQQSQIEREILTTQQEQAEQQFALLAQQAFYALQTAQASSQAAKQAQISAEQYFNITEKKYKEGLTPLIEFLDARNRLTNAHLRYLINQYDILIKLADYERVTASYPLD